MSLDVQKCSHGSVVMRSKIESHMANERKWFIAITSTDDGKDSDLAT